MQSVVWVRKVMMVEMVRMMGVEVMVEMMKAVSRL